MRANDGTRTGGEILIDQLVVHGVQHVFCVPGESYLAALDAFYDRPIKLTVCRQEGGATMMAEAVGKVTGRPGVVLRHPRAGRHQRLARHPHRAPGFDAADRVRRPGRARDARARGVPGARLPRGVRHAWPNGRPRSTIPRASPRSSRAPSTPPATAGPGPVVVALPEDMLVERVAVPDAPAFEPVETWPGLADMARLQKLLWAAKAPIVLVGGSRWSEAACASLARFAERFAHAGRHHLPPHPSDRHAASELRRRRRPRHQSEAAGAHQGGRSDRADRRPARRNSLAELFAARHSRAAPDLRARASRAPRRSAASIIRISRSTPRRPRFAAALEGLQPPNEISWRAQTKTAHADYLAWTETATPQPGGVNLGEIVVWLREQSAGGRLHHQRRRQFLRLGASLLPLPPLRHPHRRRAPARWAMACRRRSGSSARFPSARWCASPATAIS